MDFLPSHLVPELINLGYKPTQKEEWITYYDAFKFFREKFGLYTNIMPGITADKFYWYQITSIPLGHISKISYLESKQEFYATYEQAEYEAIKFLINHLNQNN